MILEKYQASLLQAKRHLQTADHLAYITFPIIKEKRLLLKVLEEANYALLNTINAILQYEYLRKQTRIFSSTQENLNLFKKLAPNYNISNLELNKLLEIIEISEKHKKSSFEFTKDDKIVITSEGMHTDSITYERIKLYLMEIKEFMRKVNLETQE